MAARQIYDPEGFRNIETDGRITGYSSGLRLNIIGELHCLLFVISRST